MPSLVKSRIPQSAEEDRNVFVSKILVFAKAKKFVTLNKKYYLLTILLQIAYLRSKDLINLKFFIDRMQYKLHLAAIGKLKIGPRDSDFFLKIIVRLHNFYEYYYTMCYYRRYK